MTDPKHLINSVVSPGSHWPHGDPFVLLDAVLRESESLPQRQQALALYLDTMAAHHQTNLKYIEGLRNIISGPAKR